MPVEQQIQRAVAQSAATGSVRPGAVRPKGLPGHVKSVKLQNFMCHQNFEMEFSSHVNFISGDNGSGKSATLQALQICLGATARETGRGTNLRSLIMTGKPEAKLAVTLWNTGGKNTAGDAYMHDRLGDWVTIERTIRAVPGGGAGGGGGVSSTWRVVGAKGRVEGATRRGLIEPMLDHLNVAADNPLCVMTQDKAREFLCSANQSKRMLYRLFMEATHMADFKDKLDRTQGLVSQMKAKVDEITAAFNEKKERHAALSKRIAKLRESEGLVARREHLEFATFWAVVREREEARDKAEREVRRLRGGDREALEAEVARLGERVDALEEERKRVAEQQAQQNVVATSIIGGMKDLMAHVGTAKREVARLKRAEQGAAEEYEETREEMTQMMESMQQATQEAGGGARQAKLLAELQEHEARVEGLRRRRAELEARVTAAEDRVVGETEQQKLLDGQVSDLVGRIKSAEGMLGNMQRDRDEMSRSKGNRMGLFGGYAMINLLSMVQAENRRFQRPPIGPIGAYLALTDDRWKTAAEALLGPHMNKWVAHCGADEQLLRAMARTAGVRPALTVITRSFDEAPVRVPPEFAAAVAGRPYQIMRDLVVVDHPEAHVIDKLLIDLSHYEKVAVAENSSLARDVTYNRVLGPRITSCISVDGTRCSRAGPGQNASTTSFGKNRQPRLGGDVASNLRELEAAISELRAKLDVLYRERGAAAAARAASKDKAQAANSEARQLKAEQNKLDRHIHQTNLQTQAHAAALQGDELEGGEGDEVHGRVLALQAKVAATQAALDEQRATLQAAEEREARASQQYESAKEAGAGAQRDMAAAREELERLVLQQEKAARRKAKLEQQINSMASSLAKAVEQCDALAKEAKEKREVALAHCDEAVGGAALDAAYDMLRAEMLRKVMKQVVAAHGRMPQEQAAAMAEEELDKLDLQLEVQHIASMHAKVQRQIDQSQQDAGGSLAELEAEEARLKAGVASEARLVGNVQKVYSRTDSALLGRQKSYSQLYESVSKTVNQKFMFYMQKRKHKGKVRIHEKEEELHLLVKPNDTGKENEGGGGRRPVKAVKDLKQLSGGERSYTNVAFMLALGEYVEAPFKCHDEYDVFMDAINRRVATETLLGFALEKDTVQHIFLTPQDVTAISDAKAHLERTRKCQLDDGFLKIMQITKPARPG
ncbi:MAG: P-loop containing nucleoside triphosphate hydrolase protein [Monoraphidium minutum]|nr:MAG: P-loop containing nucleoside triphosphate hydrolase protein [Monoraphidium minutum]